MAHANAHTNLFACRLIVERGAGGVDGRACRRAAWLSRSTVHKWLRRYAEAGDAGLADRSSRPLRMPARTSKRVEQRVLAARTRRKRGAVVLAAELGMNASAVGRILAQHEVSHLAAIDPITWQRVRTSRRSENRNEHPMPAAMIHVDVKKLGKIPPGGGWRTHGRSEAVRGRGIGYDFVHTAIDGHIRLAYSEIRSDERDATSAGFLHRALAWFTAHGVTVRRVLNDNAPVNRRGTEWAAVCTAWHVKRRFTETRCPWTNGKAERFNRTPLTEWAYARAWTSNTGRRRSSDRFLDRYNTRRGHSVLGGRPPISQLAA